MDTTNPLPGIVNSNQENNLHTRKRTIITVLFGVIGLFLICAIGVYLGIYLYKTQPQNTKGITQVNITSIVTPTIEQSRGRNVVYLSNNELWVARDGKSPLQFTSTNGSVGSFTVDENKELVYYSTINTAASDQDFNAKNRIYSCSLLETVCAARNIYSEADNVGVSDLSISPSGKFLAYDILTYINLSNNNVSSNAHILNLVTKKVIQYAKNDYPGMGILRVVGPEWFGNSFMLYNAQVDGAPFEYGMFFNELSYNNINTGDNEVRYYYSFTDYGSKTSGTDFITLHILAIDSTGKNALVYGNENLGNNSSNSFITVVPISTLVAPQTINTEAPFSNAQGSKHLFDFSSDNDMSFKAVFNDGIEIDLVLCNKTDCDLKTISENFSSVKDIGTVQPVSESITNEFSTNTYTFANGFKCVDGLNTTSENNFDEGYLIDPPTGIVYSPDGAANAKIVVF